METLSFYYKIIVDMDIINLTYKIQYLFTEIVSCFEFRTHNLININFFNLLYIYIMCFMIY